MKCFHLYSQLLSRVQEPRRFIQVLAGPLAEDPDRRRQYIDDSLIETTLSRDILLLTRVDKLALLRRLFQLACSYSGQILAYQKMLGQLVDAGIPSRSLITSIFSKARAWSPACKSFPAPKSASVPPVPSCKFSTPRS